MQEDERWTTVDRAQVGRMSLFQSSNQRDMGVFYDHFSVSQDSLELAYRQIEDAIPTDGKDVAKRLLEPFQGTQSGKAEDAWLSADVIHRFFRTIENDDIATIDSGLYHTQGFIDSLTTDNRQRLVNKLHRAQLLLWPICLGNHWYLMLIERFEGNIFSMNVLDSYNNKHLHADIARQGRGLLAKLYGDNFRVINEHYPTSLVPVQEKSFDCGTAIAYYGHKRAQRESLGQYSHFENRNCNYLQFRMQMAFDIARAAVAEIVESVRSPSPALVPQYRDSSKSRESTTLPDKVTKAVKRSKAAVKVH